MPTHVSDTVIIRSDDVDRLRAESYDELILRKRENSDELPGAIDDVVSHPGIRCAGKPKDEHVAVGSRENSRDIFQHERWSSQRPICEVLEQLRWKSGATAITA